MAGGPAAAAAAVPVAPHAPQRLRVVAPKQVAMQPLDPVDELTLAQSGAILKDVESKGEAGFLAHAVRLGDLADPAQPFLVGKAELQAAFEALSAEDRGVLERTAARIRAFASAQRASVAEVTVPVPGGMAGQTLAPVATAGCYAPGGRYPLPSSVLMTAITARVAGVAQVWVASPRPHRATLAAAHLAGADGFIACGGAHAIGAFAYGLPGKVPACDVIVGPGNRWVTAAKKLVSGRCAIDMLAGPSECLVLCDESANATTVAADLLAQAEHDTDALPILVTTSQVVVDGVNRELDRQLSTLPTAPVAAVAVSKGFSVLCADMDEALAVTNTLGPEHLEVMTKDSDATAKKCTSYGGLFVGARSAEVMGDYGAGPNHVLPTSGSAKYTGGLSVFTFLRVRTWLRLDDDDSDAQTQLVKDAVRLARIEGLEGHARAAEQRLRKPKSPPSSPKAK